MSVRSLHLKKLLKLLSLPDRRLVSALREDLRSELKKRSGDSSGGGDFHVPFWADAKSHVLGTVDIRFSTALRIVEAKGKQRLYPLLTDGFLRWFEGLRRSTNRNVGWWSEHVHNHYTISDLGVVVKVDNLLALQIDHDEHRLVYPYFSEEPALSEQWARVGLRLMQLALPIHNVQDMEILDVLRGRSFSGRHLALLGDEDDLLIDRLRMILRQWLELAEEYGLVVE